MTDIGREEIDAKLGRVSAETDTKIARIEGKLDLVLTKLDYVLKDNQETRQEIRSEARSSREITWGVGIGVMAIIIGILALFPSVFGLGTQIRDMVHTEVQQITQALPKEPQPKAP